MLPKRIDPQSPSAADDVVAFWRDAGPSRWFTKDDAFDAEFKARCEEAHLAAASGALDHWESKAQGSLALLILLDQFPRNAYRHTARMFATDGHALKIADRALDRGHDQSTPVELRRFYYLPFMHAENLAEQQRCVALCRALGDGSEPWAQVHLEVIERFGRFPHRNPLLGRTTTPEEQRFLDEGGFVG